MPNWPFKNEEILPVMSKDTYHLLFIVSQLIMGTRKRSENFSSVEKQFMIELIKNHPVVESKEGTVRVLREKNEAWKEMMQSFNSQFVANKNVNQIKVLWKHLKVKTKKTLAAANREARRTGGGVSMAHNLSQEEEEVAQIIATDLEPLSNPYDDDATNDENLAPPSPKSVSSCSSMKSTNIAPPKCQKRNVGMDLVDIEREKLRMKGRRLELEERRTIAQERIAEVR